jgi:hypothetical protein
MYLRDLHLFALNLSEAFSGKGVGGIGSILALLSLAPPFIPYTGLVIY